MPVLINELVIRAVVDPAASGGQGPASQAEHDAGQPGPAPDHAEIVQACVREVLRILAARQKR